MTDRRMPNGTVTNSETDYILAWSKMSRKLERILDCRVLGFDPNFLIAPDINAKACELPFWLAEKIIKMGDFIKTCEDVIDNFKQENLEEQEEIEIIKQEIHQEHRETELRNFIKDDHE